MYANILLDNYDPAHTIYVNNPDVINQNFENSGRYVEIIKWEADKIQFKTKTQSDQFLVISEIYYPNGWTVSSNSTEYKIYEVNNLVRGIFIPKGENEFVMSFDPYDLRIGKLISFISYILVLSLILLYSWKERLNEKIQ